MNPALSQSATIRLTFLSYWQCGTGTAGSDVDELVERENGLPIVNGRRLKGVIREAFECMERWENCAGGRTLVTDLLFGGRTGVDPSSVLMFESAHLAQEDALRAVPRKTQLFRNLRSTAIGDMGAAKPQSLRSEEAAVPLVLTCSVKVAAERTGDCPHDWVDRLAKACKLVRELGKRRTRGRGRVEIEVTRDSPAEASNAESYASRSEAAGPTEIRLVWQTRSRMVLSSHSATLGAHTSLRYLPGYKTTGLLASTLYKALGADLACKVFSRGYVRFGDGHVVHDGVRSRPVPATWVSLGNKHPATWIPLLSKDSEVVDIACRDQGAADRQDCEQRSYRPPRTAGTERTAGAVIGPRMGRSMHTALTNGVAAKSQLFSYEFIQPGTEFSGDIVISLPDEDRGKVVQALAKVLAPQRSYRLGRSHLTEYGEIRLVGFSCGGATAKELVYEKGSVISLLCESHLQVFDDQGMPTAWPVCSSWLGLPKGRLIADRSAATSSTITRYNNFYRCFETDRVVIERGSVLTYQLNEEWTGLHTQRLKLGVGEGLAEGFGEVSMLADDAFQKVNNSEESTTPSQNAETVLGKWLDWCGRKDLYPRARAIAESLQKEWAKQVETARAFNSLGVDESWAPGNSHWGELRAAAGRWRSGGEEANFDSVAQQAFGEGSDSPWRVALGPDRKGGTPTLGSWLLDSVKRKVETTDVANAAVLQVLVVEQLAQLMERQPKGSEHAL